MRWWRWLVVCGLALALSAGSAAGQVKTFVHEGRKMIRLEDLASFYGGALVPTPDGRVLLKTRWTELEFKPEERSIRIGGTTVWMHAPMQKVRWNWAIDQVDAINVIDPVMRPSEYLKATPYRVVVLDPGHGGKDPGAKGKRGSEEKHAALDIARRVRTHLVAAGLKVYMTRENDRFVGLEDRAVKAKKWGADLFVSIHLNSARSSLAKGAETFVLTSAGLPSTAGGSAGTAQPGNRFDPMSSLLGFHIQRAITRDAGAFDRGLKRARFIVLRNAPCPAALVECGFLSDPDDERKFLSEAYREEMARGIAKGIMIYVGLARQAQKVNHE